MSGAIWRTRLQGARRYTSWAWGADRLGRLWGQVELRWLVAILALATALRIVWVLYAAREPEGLHDPTFFSGYGLSIAVRGVSDGYFLPEVPPIGAGHTAYYPIGYPAALGGVYSLVGHTPIPDNLE